MKRVAGAVLLAVGLAFAVAGLFLTLTIVGAVFGVPFLVGGGYMALVGFLWLLGRPVKALSRRAQ